MLFMPKFEIVTHPILYSQKNAIFRRFESSGEEAVFVTKFDRKNNQKTA